MELLFFVSAIFVMPIFAFVFIYNFCNIFKYSKEDNTKKRNSSIIVSSIFFTLMMWTLSGAIVLSAMY